MIICNCKENLARGFIMEEKGDYAFEIGQEEVERAEEQTAEAEQTATEEENTPLSREDILEASRKENKNGDERDNKIYLRGMQLAYSIGVVLISIVILTYSILDDKIIPKELMMVYMGMTTTWTLYYAVKSGKRRPLFISCGVVCAVAFVFFTVYWILELCGVM